MAAAGVRGGRSADSPHNHGGAGCCRPGGGVPAAGAAARGRLLHWPPCRDTSSRNLVTDHACRWSSVQQSDLIKSANRDGNIY